MNRAYVTLLCNGDRYLPGVEALGESLKATGTTVPRVAMVASDVSEATRARLQELGWLIRDVAPLHKLGAKPLFPRFDDVFAKLRAWQRTEFDKVVLLDADTLVLQNIDELFLRPYFAAAPDFLMPDRFNSGVMVLDPSDETFARMVQSIDKAATYDGGDQGFLNTFFADWYAMPVAHRLPAGYNLMHFILQFLRGHPVLKHSLEKEAKVIHYAIQKPWHTAPQVSGASEDWWSMYFRAHPQLDAPWRHEVHRLEDVLFERVVDQFVR